MGRALIVSAGASSNEYIAARLTEMGYSRPVIIPSGAEARRRMTESDFELIVVNSPLPDEFGHEVCINAVEKTDAGVVFLVKAAQAEQLIVFGDERRALLLIQREHSFAKQHAEGIGEIVEGQLGGIIMRFPGPHPLLQVTIVQSVSISGFLSAFHDLA